MNKKSITIIIVLIIAIIGGYYIYSSEWFTLWRTPEPDKISSEEVKQRYEKYLQAGLDEETAGNYESAILEYKKANKIAPGAIPPKNNIAEICTKIEDYACAEEWYLEIIKRAYEPSIVIKLSKLYKEKMNNNQKAIDILLSAYEAFPNYLDFAYQLGFLYKELGDRQNALEYLNKALEIKPDDQNIKDLIGELNNQ